MVVASQPACCSAAAGLCGPVWARPGRQGPGVIRCCVRSATEMVVEVVPSGLAAMLLSAVPMSHFLSSRPCVGGHGETTKMA
jgi:hypothetical protein